MACGHQFEQISSTCTYQKTTKCKPIMPNRFISNTCADCDPAVRRKIIRAKYEHHHHRLMMKYIEIKKKRDKVRMAELKAEMLQCVNEVRRGNFEISLVRDGGDVA